MFFKMMRRIVSLSGNFQVALLNTAKNTVISPNFLVWKFCGKAQFPHSYGRPKLCRNCAFPQNFHTRKLSEIRVFLVVKPFKFDLVELTDWSITSRNRIQFKKSSSSNNLYNSYWTAC